MQLDVREDPSKWPLPTVEANTSSTGSAKGDRSALFDLVININMMHISPWECTTGMMNGVSTVLREGGILFAYGPFAHNGELKPQSNVDFDISLRERDSAWGIRDITDIAKVAKDVNLELLEIIDMPANNKCLVFQSRPK